MRRLLRNATVVLLVGLGACNGVTPPSTEPTPHPATPVRASFSRTWNAAIDLMAEASPKVGSIDRSSGLIVATGYLLTSEADTLSADCGSTAYGVVLPNEMTYNIVVHGDSTSSTVHVNSFWYTSVPGASCVSRGHWEADLEMAIKHRAETTK